MKPLRQVIEENERRRRLYFRDYSREQGDPLSEVIERRPIEINGEILYLPLSMFELPIIRSLEKCKSIEKLLIKGGMSGTEKEAQEFLNDLHKVRFNHDFEFWAITCVRIQDKLSKKIIPFKLNRGQRRLLEKYETQRLAGVPIRTIVVKARQWGGSTLTQIYMLWLQLYHYENWHSAIVSQFKTQANNIRNMLGKVLLRFPEEGGRYTYAAVTGSPSIRQITERGCEIQIGSAEQPDAVRSFDLSMAHLSEVAFWAETSNKSGQDLAQALYAAIPDVPGSFLCLESTAKGIGNFFHEKWLAAKSGESELQPVFVSWFEIEMYSRAIKDYKKFLDSMTEYNWWQWEQGATLEGINWYNQYKRDKGYSDFQMCSEYPTTATEAFQTKAGRYFEMILIEQARSTCKKPLFIGDIRGNSPKGKDALRGLHLVENNTGGSELLKIWQMPETFPNKKILHRFIVVVDIGGKSYSSDNSVISVFDRYGLMDPFGALERAAIWIGHIDHDILAWKAAQIATFFDNALLVIESNTIDSRDKKKSDSIIYEGDHFYTVIDEIANEYSNLYARGSAPDKAIDNGMPIKFGWHMNKKTKYQAYDSYTARLRDGEFVERSSEAVNEMEWLQIDSTGGINAVAGKRDDTQDTNAIGSFVAFEDMPLPKAVEINKAPKQSLRSGKSAGVATI